MKPEHKDLNPTELCLLTWYKPDNPLYKDPEHPTIKLAGEIGELLDLYGKEKYKPGFDWMNCKWCNSSEGSHKNNYCPRWLIVSNEQYTPIVLDELGDIWYYLRILAWQRGIKIIPDITDVEHSYADDFYHIKTMYYYADCALQNNLDWTKIIDSIYYRLCRLLDNLDYTIEQLTELNYYKLNSDETNHGWKDAR